MTLFYERCLRQWRGVGRFMKQFIDGVMWIYLIIAALIAIYAIVTELLMQGHYGLLSTVPAPLLLIALFSFCGLFTTRLFIEDADRLFLLRNVTLYKQLKRSSYIYSIFVNLLIYLFIYGLLFYLFSNVHMFSKIQLMQLLVAMISCSIICDQLWFIWQKLIRIIVHTGIIGIAVISVLYASPTILFVTLLVMSIVIFLVDRLFLTKHKYFDRQIVIEQQRAHKVISIILQVNPEMKGLQNVPFSKKSPILFKRIYSHSTKGAIVELIFKSLWRNKSYRKKLLQLICISFVLLIVLPIWGKCIVLVFFFVAILQFIDSLAIEIKDHAAFKQLSFTSESWNHAMQLVKRRLIVPIMCLFVAVLVVMYSL